MKQRAMVVMWRLQQSNRIVGAIFFPLLFSIQYFRIFRDPIINFLRGFGIPAGVISGAIFFFFIVVVAILVLGLAYDRALRLWKDQQTVVQERSPFARGMMHGKDAIYFTLPLIVLMRLARRNDNDLADGEDFYLRYLDGCLASPLFHEMCKELFAFTDKAELNEDLMAAHLKWMGK